MRRTALHRKRSLTIAATLALITAALIGGCGAKSSSTAAPPELVDITAVAPSIRLDMRYATTNNFTGRQLYPAARCLLRPAVAERLARAQADLEPRGLTLVVFDCYRPLSVQKEMWAIKPDPRYVADPSQGSKHNRGAAVDVTLARLDGGTVRMPTDFDDFSERAHRVFNNLPPTVRVNRAMLERAMRDQGFVPLATEWWHFDAPDWQRYEILDVPLQ